jgi:hypothetical protein
MKKWSQEMVSAFETVQESKIRDLLNLGFPPESPLVIRDGESLIERTYPVHLSCQYNFLPVLQELIRLGCNIEILDSYRRTPLMVACEAGNLEIVEFLTITCKVSTKGQDYAGNTVLHIASINGQLAVLKFLVDTLGLSIKTLNSQKKTALALCRDIYASKFDPVIEKTLSFLIYKNSQTDQELTQPNTLEPVHLNNFSCHEMCKEKYFHQHGFIRTKLRSFGNLEFVYTKKTDYLKSKRKIRSFVGNSFEEVASIRSDLVFRKVMQEEAFVEKGKKILGQASSPLLMLKELNGSMSGGSRKPRSGPPMLKN